jgi:hypothetical protein
MFSLTAVFGAGTEEHMMERLHKIIRLADLPDFVGLQH